MAFVTFVSLVVVLAIGFVPVWLLRHAPKRSAQDDFVGAQRTRLAVVRNASIAYALRMAAFVPLFAWGASGDLLPAVVASACFGLGTWLVYVARRPLLEFLDDALTGGRSVTVHAFIARAHGNDPRVRLVAAGITLCALFGLVIGEALAAAAFLGPMLKANATLAALLLVAALLSLAATAALSGHAGIMHSAQLQLGMLYFGLFGATLLVLYLHVSARTPLPPHVGVAVAFAAVFAVLVLWYRRSRYVDTETIRSDGAEGCADGSRAARALRRFGKILNGVAVGAARADRDRGAHGSSSGGRIGARARERQRRLRSGTRISGVGPARADVCCRSSILSSTSRTGCGLRQPGRTSASSRTDGAAALRGVFAVYAAGDNTRRPSRLRVRRDRRRRVRAAGDDGRRGGVRCPARVARQLGRRHRLGAVRDLRLCGGAVDDGRAAGRGRFARSVTTCWRRPAPARRATRRQQRARRRRRNARCVAGAGRAGRGVAAAVACASLAHRRREQQRRRARVDALLCAARVRAARAGADRRACPRRQWRGERRLGAGDSRGRLRRRRGGSGRIPRYRRRRVAVVRRARRARFGLRAVRDRRAASSRAR